MLEVELPEAGSVDFEDLEGTLGDEESDAWLQEQQIHTVFAVTIRPDDYELAKKVMEHIVSLSVQIMKIFSRGFLQRKWNRQRWNHR